MSSDTFAPAAFPRFGLPVDLVEQEAARRRGYAEGHAEGIRAARVEAETAAAEATASRRAADDAAAVVAASAATALDAAATALTESADRLAALDVAQVQALAVELAEAILERELSDDVRSALTTVARVDATIADVDAAASVVVVSTRDFSTLQRLGAHPDGVQLEASADLAPGDAVVRLPDGAVDLRVGAALERVRTALGKVDS